MICGKGTMFRKNNRIWKQGHFKGMKLHGQGVVFANNGTIEQEGKFMHGKLYDENALMIQKFVDTRDSSVLKTISAKKIQNYIETKFNVVYPNQKPKEYLRRQLTVLTKTPEEPTVDENYDAFGNEIVRRCLGNDGNIYDIQSMSYLFQQDEQGQYVNIRYGYVDGERRPNFPIMGNGKRLDGYRILSEVLDLDNINTLPPMNL